MQTQSFGMPVVRASWRGPLLAALGLLAACNPARAVQDVASALYFYDGDAFYLNSWAARFTNLPESYWNTRISPPCPTGNWVGLECNADNYATSIDLSVSSNSSQPRLRGPFGYEVAGVLFLTSINMAGNRLRGSLPAELSLAPSLTSLNVENNKLSGTLPTQLCSLSSLQCLHLANNSFSGEIPSCWSKFPCLDFAGNKLNITKNVTCQDVPYKSCAIGPAISAPPPPPGEGGPNVGAIVGGVVGGLAFLALLLAGVMFYLKFLERKRKREEEIKLAHDIEAQISSRHFGTLRRFSVSELAGATKDFDEDNLLGEGGFSKVYKGTLEGGKVVAVKRIKDERKAGGELEFLNEVELISRAVHRNLMHSEGFCVDAGECMLVLPFYANGSVASRTQGKEGNPLDWPTRQKIAQGAAEGVAYLHTDCNPKLIHRDIKAANVLLDDDHEAIIADFGLAKEMDLKDSHATTAIKGTIGHIAPEYFVSGQCSEKTDVFGFGVFLMELVSGKDVYQLSVQAEAEDVLLRDWVSKMMQEGKMAELVDKELELDDAQNRGEVVKMLQVALLCMQNEAHDRPTMEEVAKMLSGKGLAEKWQKWQAEAGNIKAEDLLQIVNTPGIWNNLSTGVSLEGFGVQGPR